MITIALIQEKVRYSLYHCIVQSSHTFMFFTFSYISHLYLFSAYFFNSSIYFPFIFPIFLYFLHSFLFFTIFNLLVYNSSVILKFGFFLLLKLLHSNGTKRKEIKVDYFVLPKILFTGNGWSVYVCFSIQKNLKLKLKFHHFFSQLFSI